jgi:hypothetical protein
VVVGLALRPSNFAPEAIDDRGRTDEDVAVTIDVLANDSDSDGDALTVIEVGSALNGTAALNSDATVTYEPSSDFNGSDSFTYTITDGELLASATVLIEVTSVNDAPVANDDVAVLERRRRVIVPVLENDTDVDGDELAITRVDGEKVTRWRRIFRLGSGAFVRVTRNGEVQYIARRVRRGDHDGSASDSFTYTVSDKQETATATVFISSPRDAADDDDSDYGED